MARGRSGGLLALALLAIVTCVLVVDDRAADLSHDLLHGHPIFVALTHLVDPAVPSAAVGFLAIGGAMALGARPGAVMRTLLCVCVATLLAVAVKDQLKYLFGRTWPETWVNNNPSWIHDRVDVFAVFHGGAGWASFPSGHMTAITAPMAVLIHGVRPRWRFLLSIPVVLVAVGLYGADYHFVGDILAGTLLGAVCAAIVVRLLGSAAQPAPAPGAATAVVGVSAVSPARVAPMSHRS